jgi:hypothetical protein
MSKFLTKKSLYQRAVIPRLTRDPLKKVETTVRCISTNYQEIAGQARNDTINIGVISSLVSLQLHCKRKLRRLRPE